MLLLLLTVSVAAAQTPSPASPPASSIVPPRFEPDGDPVQPPNPLVQKIQDELSRTTPAPETTVDPSVAKGEILSGRITNSTIYPGTENDFKVYVPAEFDPSKPACLLVQLDGFGSWTTTILDNMIAKKELPVIIDVGVIPGTLWEDPAAPPGPSGSPKPPQRHAYRFNRCYEFDSMNDHFPDYVINELLPAVLKMKTRDGRAITISSDPNDRAVTGGSSGAIGAFTLAWRRPDQFSRVYDVIGTFVAMRGGNEYPALIRKTEPKPLRIFLEDGSADAWNPLFGIWFDANRNMESALRFAGCDIAHAWGTHGHSGEACAGIFPDVMRWLWRDYPAPVKAGISTNSTLKEITVPDQGWQKIPQTFQSAAGLATNAEGDVYLSDASAATVYHLGADDKAAALFQNEPGIVGQAFGPDGTLYCVIPSQKKIIAIDPQGNTRTVADGIAGHGILVTHDSTLYITEPGEHTDMPSQIWQIKSTGEKKIIDQGLSAASGLAFSPDGSLFFAAENSTKWLYSYVVRPDGSFADKQPFYWLHMTDIPNNSGAEDLAVDTHGNLYVATRMGVQVCDQNGRVRAILPLPTPCGPVRSLCFGGEHFDILYVTDGRQVFKRPLKIPGIAPWAVPVKFPSQGMG
jgi:gluconolactonase